MIFLFSYFFANSRAGRITSNEEYIESLKEASRGRKLAGKAEIPEENMENERDRVELDENSISQPNNLFEELWFQLKAVFNVR